MDEGAAEVGELLLVDAAVDALEVARRCADNGVFDDGGAHEVDGGLVVVAEVDEAVAAGAALDGEQRVEDEGVAPVGVQPGGVGGDPFGDVVGSVLGAPSRGAGGR